MATISKTKRNKIRTVYWVLNYAKNNIHGLSKKNFLKYHGKNSEIFYKQLKIEDINKLQNRLRKNKDKIERLNDYRDQYLAHDDMKKIKVKLTIREMDVLLRIVKDVIELFYNKLKSTSNSYINFEQEPVRNLNNIMEDLKRQVLKN